MRHFRRSRLDDGSTRRSGSCKPRRSGRHGCTVSYFEAYSLELHLQLVRWRIATDEGLHVDFDIPRKLPDVSQKRLVRNDSGAAGIEETGAQLSEGSKSLAIAIRSHKPFSLQYRLPPSNRRCQSARSRRQRAESRSSAGSLESRAGRWGYSSDDDSLVGILSPRRPRYDSGTSESDLDNGVLEPFHGSRSGSGIEGDRERDSGMVDVAESTLAEPHRSPMSPSPAPSGSSRPMPSGGSSVARSMGRASPPNAAETARAGSEHED